ncbi:hypothetical protein AAHA92_14156 [Salvia divinorum]|uniref:Uncharacterized protein n=1 Tax=Salvia divinorum TaxID=28513 RepID=A0ABD1HAL6_SALDI
MCCLIYRVAILVFFCVGLLSIQPETVSATRSIGLDLRGGGGRLLLALEEAEMPFNIAPSPAMAFDPNQSEKRTVRGGSDPIHNRS